MGTTFTRNSFIRENRLHYKLKYIEKMEVLMKLLIEQGDYTGAAGYCKTYEKSKGVFTDDWEIIDLRE